MTATAIIKHANRTPENVAHCWTPKKKRFSYNFFHNQQGFSAPSNETIFMCMHNNQMFDISTCWLCYGKFSYDFQCKWKGYDLCKFGNTSVLVTINASTKLFCIPSTYTSKLGCFACYINQRCTIA